jgi:hypothetical protein
MKGKKYYLILAAAVGCICVPLPGRTELLSSGEKSMFISQPHPAFAGIDELHVSVLRYGARQDNDVPVFKRLKATVREKLQQAGIESDTSAADNILSIPELRIYVSTLSPENSQQRVFHIRTALARAVCLKDKQNPVFKADIWQTIPVMQTISAENIPAKITDVVLEQVESFIHAYKATNQAARQSSEAKISESDSPAVPQNQIKTDAESATAKYVASKSSNVFHKPDCRWAKNISSENLVTYKSKDEAIKAGKRPCKTCNP